MGGGPASRDVSKSWPVSAGEPHSLREESGQWYSQGWILRVDWNGQGEAGIVVVSTEEAISVSRVIDRVISVEHLIVVWVCISLIFLMCF